MSSFWNDGPGFPGTPEWDEFFNNFSKNIGRNSSSLMDMDLDVTFEGKRKTVFSGYLKPKVETSVGEVNTSEGATTDGSIIPGILGQFLGDVPFVKFSGEIVRGNKVSKVSLLVNHFDEDSNNMDGNQRDDDSNEEPTSHAEQGNSESKSDDQESSNGNEEDGSRGEKRKAEDDPNPNVSPKASQTEARANETPNPNPRVEFTYEGNTFRFYGDSWPVQFTSTGVLLSFNADGSNQNSSKENENAQSDSNNLLTAVIQDSHYVVRLSRNPELFFELYPRSNLNPEDIKMDVSANGIISIIFPKS